jgi:hypothetical protein
MPALAIDELIFKGTHNSYACSGGAPPWMNHPPRKQIDDFGVWALELDYSVLLERGGPVAVVGHDRESNASCWGYYLTDYLEDILGAKALAYRPVFVCLEVKTWKRWWRKPWRLPIDRAFGFGDKWDAGQAALTQACGDRLVILEEWLEAHDGRWPLPAELAGKVVFYEPNKLDADGRLVGLRGMHASACVTPARVADAIAAGRPLERNSTPCPGGARVLRLDQYQADWTFEYGVPPNPVVVEQLAQASTAVDDAEGRPWRCGVERSHGQLVGEHGTYRFPYRSIEAAIERARGVTSLTQGASDDRRAGYGWTVLIRNADGPAPQAPQDVPLRFEVV